MEEELNSMGVNNGDMAAICVILMNMSIKKLIEDHEVKQGGNEAYSHA